MIDGVRMSQVRALARLSVPWKLSHAAPQPSSAPLGRAPNIIFAVGEAVEERYCHGLGILLLFYREYGYNAMAVEVEVKLNDTGTSWSAFPVLCCPSRSITC